ncbi:MAG: bifunctional demethylmenaquinone methyltransferase/2-methoxy-6-polyprenyl-1,4-benzoquinol methylase UbiE [Thermodesulfobacteriota bacterium]
MAKGHEVQAMFDSIAGRYDLLNRVMTLGQDQRWRRFVVDKVGDPGPEAWLLDLATGTGDIAALFSEKYPDAQIIGADFSQNMLQEAKRRMGARPINWQACDANQLPFADNSLRAVTFGYLLRNVADVAQVLTEINRVLVPGGIVVSLDTTPPAKNILYPFIRAYLRWGIPLLGRVLALDQGAYSYLTQSTMEFYGAEALAGIFQEAGFADVAHKRFMAGTIAVHWGRKVSA